MRTELRVRYDLAHFHAHQRHRGAGLNHLLNLIRGLGRGFLGVEDGHREPTVVLPGPVAGLHQLRVRATDSAGVTQTPRDAASFPDGASGWDSVVVTVT